ncbi:hypothetical protein GCM10011506_03590 [Marivirga lumbricoides]|uniref:ASPIC/UnbV domain-containing protein n=1 Tax=Marivirga lumbricoides TaxID=1046115 RepID=A0ABQ1LCT6_9BACT|nr:hypothetical protein GCM10011506_03590 [Marivirga lumbricoides]
MHKYLFLPLISLFLVISTELRAQVNITSSPQAEVNIGVSAGSYQINIENTSEAILQETNIVISLPEGMQYVVGSLQETSNFQVAIADASNLSQITLQAADLPAGESYQLSIQYSGSCEAVAHQWEGNIFRNIVSLQSSLGNFNHTSSAYNILYPSLSITRITSKNKSIANKESYVRKITIVNGGNGGINQFFLSDDHLAGLQITNVNVGQLTGDSLLSLSATDFSTIGNGDGIFDSNESIVIEETVYAESCSDVTYTSEISAFWLLDESICQTTTSYANTYVDYIAPNLNQTATPSFNTCYSDSPSQQILKVTNTTGAIARNLSVEIFNASNADYDPTLYSKIDVNSITYKIGENGALKSITPSATLLSSTGGNYSCLGANAVGGVTLDLPDVGANEEVYIYWNTLHCCINSCIGAKLGGWKSRVVYEDNCGKTFENTIKGQDPVQASMSFFTETPAHISDGQKKTFNFLVSGHKNTYPAAEGAYYEVLFQLPAGLVYEGMADDLLWSSSPNVWTPNSIIYNAVNNTLTAQFPYPANFDLPKTEISLKLKASCANANGQGGAQNIQMSVNFIADPGCESICAVALACSQTVSTTLICPNECEEGMAFQNFTIERTSFGKPDNNGDGYADASATLDFSKVKTNRVMTNDTIKAVFYGKVKASGQHPSWQYGYAQSTIELGSYLTPISAEVQIFDASANTQLYANNVDLKQTKAGETAIFDMDFSVATLVFNGNLHLGGFRYEDEDLVELTVYYTLSTNLGGRIKEVEVNNAFYLSDVERPASSANKFQCGFYDERITLMGHYFYTDKGTYTTISSCSQYIDQWFYLSIGDCCSNYNGGNLFPYEYRNWSWMKEAKVTIPEGYEVGDIRMQQWATMATNTHIFQQATNLNPDSRNGQELYFDLAQYYEQNGGSIHPSDDGFKGRLRVQLLPTCEVPTTGYTDVHWAFAFNKAERLEGGIATDWMSEQPDKVKFSPAALRITPLNPKEDGLGKTVTWTVKIENTANNAQAGNAWIHLNSASGSIQVKEVKDAATDQVISLTGDIYRIGEIGVGATKTYEITASYSACNMESIKIYSGYECAGYPENFADFTCPYTQSSLSVEPKPAQYQVRIKSEFAAETCSNDMMVTVEVRSVQLAAVDSLKINFFTPESGSISYLANSSELLYNLNDSYRIVAEPNQVDNKYSYELASLDTNIGENGLPGVLDLENNTLKLKFWVQLNPNFRAGEYLQVNVQGQATCGLSLPEINLAVDPSIQFEKDTHSGLSGGASNSWAASWGDYDNDGYEDLFVPEYDAGKASKLYHNNGDGTFTIASTIINSDLTSATTATWGDYDNDGHLDLYVATNVGSPGLLYHNNGNGSFTKITSGDIATDQGYDHSASWVDYDNDGYLDLFVLDMVQTKFNRLYHNNGDGTFTKIADASIATAISSSFGATWSDYDNDGDMDVFIPNREQENFLYRNEGAGEFTRITEGIIVNENLGSVGASWGDYDNDGDMDLFVANPGTKYNTLYNNQGNGSFIKITNSPITSDKGNTHGSAWVDLDNDGDLDLYVTNDAGEGNFLYMNNGDGSFQKIENDLTETPQKSFGTAVADYDNDGDLDIFVANHSGEANQLYINSRGRCNQSICMTLIGTVSNKSAIGAKVKMRATINGETVWQMREVSAQTGGGIGSQNSLKVFFGLGDATQAEEVIIEWPSGIIQKISNLSAGTCTEIGEAEASKVAGYVYHDANGNCTQDAGELGIPHQTITISGETTYQLRTDENGYYEVYLGNGSYQLNANLNAGWSNCNASGYTTQLTASGQDKSLNFGATSACNQPDLSINAGTTVLHKGFENVFVITYENMGTVTAEGVNLLTTLPTEVEIVESEHEYINLGNGTYSWNLPDLESFKKHTFKLTTRTLLGATIGNILNTQFEISTSNGECNSADNSYQDQTEVVGAIDPNDLWVSKTAIDQLNEPLEYLIRFQNVGNYPATFVKVVDQLSSQLDMSSLAIVSTSHEVTEFYVEGNTISWKFDQIHLPDSTRDEAGSHGYIRFRVKPKTTLSHRDIIENQVKIIFDFEMPIYTNIVSTIYFDPAQRRVNVYPNPINAEHEKLNFSGDMMYPFNFSIYNSLGVKIAEKLGHERSSLDISQFGIEAGMYLYRVHDDNGLLLKVGRLVVQ